MDASATGFASPWLFCTINLNREKGVWNCEWLDDLPCDTNTTFCTNILGALQETDNETTFAMNVPVCIVYC